MKELGTSVLEFFKKDDYSGMRREGQKELGNARRQISEQLKTITAHLRMLDVALNTAEKYAQSDKVDERNSASYASREMRPVMSELVQCRSEVIALSEELQKLINQKRSNEDDFNQLQLALINIQRKLLDVKEKNIYTLIHSHMTQIYFNQK